MSAHSSRIEQDKFSPEVQHSESDGRLLGNDCKAGGCEGKGGELTEIGCCGGWGAQSKMVARLAM